MSLQAQKSFNRDMSDSDLSSLRGQTSLSPSLLNGDRMMEGWLFRFGRHRYGKSYLHKRYFTLDGRVLAYYKHRPNGKEVPVRSLLIEADTRVVDRGLEKHKGHMLCAITICNKGQRSKPITLGAASPEEAHVWKEAVERATGSGAGSISHKRPATYHVDGIGLHEASDYENGELPDSHSKELKPPTPVTKRIQSIGPGGTPKQIVDWTAEDRASSTREWDRHWRLIRCENGLRIFEELPDPEIKAVPAVKSVGVVEASSDQIFNLLMAIDSSCYEWDPLFDEAAVVEHVDGHTDVVHQKLLPTWWLFWPRDLCYTRYWRRKEDGSYDILYNSMEHEACPAVPGYVRAHINCAGYVITPLRGPGGAKGPSRSRVEHVLSMDAKGWGGRWFYQQHIMAAMLNRIAGVREAFASSLGPIRPSLGGVTFGSTVRVLTQNRGSPTMSPLARVAVRPKCTTSRGVISEDEAGEQGTPSTSQAASSSDDDDEYQIAENGEYAYGDISARSTAPGSPNYAETRGEEKAEVTIAVNSKDFKCNFPEGDLEKGKDCWADPGGSTFRVRSKTFLTDRRKVQAGPPFCKLAAVDWFKASKRIDHVARRAGGVVEQAIEKGHFTIVINMQVPGATHYSMVFYFIPQAPIKPGSLLHRYIHGDDRFRNNRLKLIPAVPKGNWIVKQSVGTIPCIVGRALDCTYHRSAHYLEIDVDIGSSVVADGILRLVFGYVSCLVVDMGFLLQGTTPEELPEQILGSVRISKMALESAELIDPETLNPVPK